MNKNVILNNLRDYKVAKKARIWKLIPLAGRNRFSTTFSETIYLTPKRFADWQRPMPNNSTIALMAHEALHVDQLRREKNFKRNYLRNKRFRLKMEAEGYAMQAYIRELLGTNKGVEHYLGKYSYTLTQNYKLSMAFAEVYKAVIEEYNKLKGIDR